MASARPKAKGTRLVPEINVTPLVDVVLVLLIIFMVIAPQLENGERIELPVVQNVAAKNQLDAVTLTVTASGRYILEKEAVNEPDIALRLGATHDEHPDKRLVLKADRGVSYGVMRRLFATAQTLGFHGVALTVDERAR